MKIILFIVFRIFITTSCSNLVEDNHVAMIMETQEFIKMNKEIISVSKAKRSLSLILITEPNNNLRKSN